MTRILVLEGNPRSVREQARPLKIRSGGELYTSAIKSIAPDLECDVAFAADSERPLPAGASFRDYAGLAIGGSALHAYARVPEVERQMKFLCAVADEGLPILGSCWGLQLAALAAGGEVRSNPHGREIGVARKISVTQAGGAHSLFTGKGGCFDALCIHYDEVSRAPPGAITLASNRHSQIQAAQFKLRRSDVWGVQYHPEFDVAQMAHLLRLYGDDLVSQGFFADHADRDGHLAAWDALASDPQNGAVAWQLGLDDDTLDEGRRRLEIRNWLRQFVL